MIKKNKNVRQHFIPKCYLKNFTKNEKFVFVYSKTNQKSYAQSISKIAYKDYFYTIPEKYLNKEVLLNYDSNFIEKHILADNIESLYSELLKKIVQAESEWSVSKLKKEILSNKERDLFAALIAIQYLRMPNVRDMYWDANQKAQKTRNEIIQAFKNFPGDIDDSEFVSFSSNDDYAPVLHSQLFLNEKLITEIQNHLIKKNWRYRVASNGSVFTSDNPILLKPHLINQVAFYSGFAMKGVEVIFPISKNIILTIWDEDVFPNYISENNEFSVLTDKELREYNCYQYIWANEEVYSTKNNFKLIEQLKLVNGDVNKEIFKPRPKIKINGK